MYLPSRGASPVIRRHVPASSKVDCAVSSVPRLRRNARKLASMDGSRRASPASLRIRFSSAGIAGRDGFALRHVRS